MLNNVRLAAGKPSLGWLNPFIYSTASTAGCFNDIGTVHVLYPYLIMSFKPYCCSYCPYFIVYFKRTAALFVVHKMLLLFRHVPVFLKLDMYR